MTDSNTVDERLRFLQIDESTGAAMQEVQEVIEDALDDLLDRFYAHILQEPKLKVLFPDPEAVDAARNAQKRHWLETLFVENPGPSQFDRAKRIGEAHVCVGLTPSWYMSGYCFMLNQFVDLLANRFEDDAKTLNHVVQALNKLVFLDMNFVIDSYLEAKNRTMRKILSRATRFTEDVERLNNELAGSVRDLQEQAEPLLANDDTLKEQLTRAFESISTLIEDSNTAHHNKQQVLESFGDLTEKVEELDARLKQLMFGDRLWSRPDIDDSFTERVRDFVNRHLTRG